jgi:hypothetical protein
MQTSFPLRNLRDYENLGEFIILGIDGTKVILDKPFTGRAGDFIARRGELKVGVKVTAYRPKAHAPVQ